VVSRQEEEAAPLPDEVVVNTAAEIGVLPGIGDVMNPVAVNIIAEGDEGVHLTAATVVLQVTVMNRMGYTRMTIEGPPGAGEEEGVTEEMGKKQ